MLEVYYQYSRNVLEVLAMPKRRPGKNKAEKPSKVMTARDEPQLSKTQLVAEFVRRSTTGNTVIQTS
jgi:hypothetical protein